MNYKSSKVIHYWELGLNGGVACRVKHDPSYKWPATTLTKLTTCKRCLNTKVFKESLEHHNEL